MKCNNCGTPLGCGCQVRKLPNGKTGCIKCINQLQKEDNKLTQKSSNKNG